jgi:hypothetical protein
MNPRIIAIALLLIPGLLLAEAHQVDEYQWEGVERIVAVGDIHGDFDNYMATLKSAGLVDKKGKWAGGKTHLVQVGDLPDRGPDTLEIIDHVRSLTKQAKRKGGRVHSLIGNHEAMNVMGDLRYVHPGEYEAFVVRKSAALRDRYYQLSMERIKKNEPEVFAALPEDYRDQWNKEHPLGWLEHRQAWDPWWNKDAELAKWVLQLKIAVRVNDTVFLHGGISGFYCENSLSSLTEKAVAQLANFDPAEDGIVGDPNGPLWYRGLSGVEPEAPMETVDAILANHTARRIVVGHTPTLGVIWPRYDGKVVMIDTGISSHYGGHIGYLEITPEGAFAGYPGGKIKLPSSDDASVEYLEQVIAMNPDNPNLKRRLKKLLQPAVEDSETAPAEGEAEEEPEISVPICGTS